MRRIAYPIAFTYGRSLKMEKDSVLVFNPKIARDLIKKGFNIIDIKPFKEDKDRTIFVFQRTEEILKEIHS